MIRLKKRNNKKFFVGVICITLAFIVLGFSALSATLGIRGNATFGKVLYDIHFDNIIVSEGSMEAKTPANINSDDKMNIDCALELTEPGQYYEFEVDVVNRGTLDAALSSIEISGLDESSRKYLAFNYKYANGKEIQLDDILPAGTSNKIKIRIEFKYDISFEDLPSEGALVKIKYAMNYVQDKEKRLLYTKLATGYDAIDNIASEYVKYDNGINLGYISSDTNGKGLYLRAGTENDKYPIYYYRGEVNNNNVLFGGKCWKIVRTTETGGIKLLYNGVQNYNNPNGVCNNSGEDSQIGINQFGSSTDNLAYVGYMYSSNASKYISYSNDMTSSGIMEGLVTLEEDEYINIVNDSTYAYTFDSATKKWSSNMKTHSKSASIIFNVANSGEYYLSYTISSEELNDKASIYINGEKKAYDISGSGSGQFELGVLTPTDQIKIIYSKDSSTSTGRDNIVFSLDKNDGTAEDKRWIFGNSVIYENGVYTLKNTKRIAWQDDISNYHYTCFSTESSCSSVKYVYSSSIKYARYFSLTGGNKVEDLLNDLLPNDKTRNEVDSPIKEYIDNWYSGENGLMDYTEFLEDTIWCNDREITDLAGFNPNGGVTTEYLKFATATRGTSNSILTCSNKYDRFTLKSELSNSNKSLNGNQMLDYPVGLLTLDELSISGLGETSFIASNFIYWTLSPRYIYASSPNVVRISTDGRWGSSYTSYTGNGVRPAVSLKHDVRVMRGTGTAKDPYVITE